jgi:ATP:ADP antiporter, AAA family
MKIFDHVRYLQNLDSAFRKKVIWMSVLFFLVIGAYTSCGDMKDIVFVEIVGIEYITRAKVFFMLVLFPAVLVYSYLVSKFKRYQVLCACAILYGVLGLVFAYFLGHPEIGIANTDADPGRMMGWLFYFFVEGYFPFLVSVVWAFSNSIFQPEEARSVYGLFTVSAQVGGVLSAGLGWLLLRPWIVLSSLVKQQALLVWPSMLVLFMPFVIMRLMSSVSKKSLLGYKSDVNCQKTLNHQKVRVGLFEGLKLLVMQPYVFGIFILSFLYSIVITMLKFLRILYAKDTTLGIDAFGSKLFATTFEYQALGLLIALFGASFLLRVIGVRRCLILVPIVIGVWLAVFTLFDSYETFMLAFIFIRAIDYGFLSPVSENLYVPTTKEIKFKSKAWIDSFGGKLAKGLGAKLNLLAEYLIRNIGVGAAHSFYGVVFGAIIGFWVVVAMLVGKRYEGAIKQREVIGVE